MAVAVRVISPWSAFVWRLMTETLPDWVSTTSAKRLDGEVATAVAVDPLGTETVARTLEVTASMIVTEWLPEFETTTSGSECELGAGRQ